VRFDSTYHTSSESIGLSGSGHATAKSGGCKSAQSLRISWHNASNGTTGIGSAYVVCPCIVIMCVPDGLWNIGDGSIPLEIGENKITVTARAFGKSAERSITIVRSEATTLSAEYVRPTLAPPGDGYQFTRLTQGQLGTSISHLHYRDAPRLPSSNEELPPKLNKMQVLSDLAHHVTPSEYDFILMYSLSDWPGWSELHGPCIAPAENTGFENRLAISGDCADIPADWQTLRGLAISPIQDSHSDAIDPNILTAMHKMGQAWGVFWDHSMANVDGANTCSALEDSASGHRAVPVDWYSDEEAGLLQGLPIHGSFNALDLYAMGLMGYAEAQHFEYLVYQDSEHSTLQSISVDAIIAHLPEHGSEYHIGDGKRRPDTDISTENMRALVVLLTAGPEEASAAETEQLFNLSRKLPSAWNEATWRRSAMSMEILER
jgi:hypothetical protein